MRLFSKYSTRRRPSGEARASYPAYRPCGPHIHERSVAWPVCMGKSVRCHTRWKAGSANPAVGVKPGDACNMGISRAECELPMPQALDAHTATKLIRISAVTLFRVPFI